jgi:prepilin-type N-terminal cleavage/methylation domain-containing protein
MNDKGFSLIEVTVATLILTVASLAMLGVMTLAVQRATSSGDAVIAREKAREAIESVHAARDTGDVSWPSIQNTGAGGLFLTGAQSLRVAGNDGLVNTADDGDVETLRTPGYDGILGNEDDVVRSMTDFTREIVIGNVLGDNGEVNPNLREVTVNIRYQVRGTWHVYTLRTFVSAFL